MKQFLTILLISVIIYLMLAGVYYYFTDGDSLWAFIVYYLSTVF